LEERADSISISKMGAAHSPYMSVISTKIHCVTSQESIQTHERQESQISLTSQMQFNWPSVLSAEYNLQTGWMRLWRGPFFDSRSGRLPTSHHNKCLAPCGDLAYISPHQLAMRCDAMRSIPRGEQKSAMPARHHANTGWGRKITLIPLKGPPNPFSHPSWT
jgi:hypothetical protein